jgi:hypothetical protein
MLSLERHIRSMCRHYEVAGAAEREWMATNVHSRWNSSRLCRPEDRAFHGHPADWAEQVAASKPVRLFPLSADDAARCVTESLMATITALERASLETVLPGRCRAKRRDRL